MMAMLSAFMSLVFGYFFFWTVRDDFPPEAVSGPGAFWPPLGAALLAGAWSLTLLARYWNRHDSAVGFYIGLLLAIALAIAGAGALLGLVYSATGNLLLATLVHAFYDAAALLYVRYYWRPREVSKQSSS